MSEQPLDLRLTRVALRRYRKTIGVLALVGAATGTALALVLPPPYTSTSLVQLQSATDSQGASLLDITTQAEIARSQPVMDQAIEVTGSSLTVKQLQDAVDVTTPTDFLLEFSARADIAADAQDLAAAVADSYATYVEVSLAPLVGEALAQLKSQQTTLQNRAKEVESELASARERLADAGAGGAKSDKEAQLVALLVSQQSDLAVQLSKVEQAISLGGQNAGTPTTVSANVIQSGTAATRPSKAARSLLWAAALALLGAVVGVLYAVVRVRRERRLYSAADLVRALGAPILAGVTSRPQRRPEDWPGFLSTYEAPPVDAWAVRLLLRDLLGSDAAVRPGEKSSANRSPTTAVLLSFVGDARGAAVGPQIAVIAASLGVRTALAIRGPTELAGGLYAGVALASRLAVAVASPAAEVRPNLVLTPQELSDSTSHELGLVLTPVDPGDLDLADLPDAQAYLLCVGRGAATSDEIARLSLAVDDGKRRIAGAVLADPESWDVAVTGPTQAFVAPVDTPAPVSRLQRQGGSPPKVVLQRSRKRP